MAITRESAREMSDEALAYTLNDLNEVINICEADFKANYAMPGYAYDRPIPRKHSQYLDERFAVIEALVARRECPH